jgi:HNH endonuclease
MEQKDGKLKWTEEEKQRNRGRVWITNGKEGHTVPKQTALPEGWWYGRRTPSPKKGITDKEYYGEERAKVIAEKKSQAMDKYTPWNLGVPHTPEAKKNISRAKLGKSIASRGIPKDYPAWNLGKRESEVCTSYKAYDWADEVKKRDNYHCQHCGRTSDLHAHHIKAWKPYPESRFILENGLTLCDRCHFWLESVMRQLKREFGELPSKFEIHPGEWICSKCHRQILDLVNLS